VVGAKAIDDVLRIQAAHRGMFDVIDLSLPARQLISHLHSISLGNSSLSKSDLWRRVPRPSKVADITTVPQDTTDLSILELICIGYRDQDIAEVLGYSVQAVKNRLGAMLKRSGVSNRTQLAWQFTNQLLTARMIQNMQQARETRRNDNAR
jgi:DNA-binding NarL/FixJ family response regulator